MADSPSATLLFHPIPIHLINKQLYTVYSVKCSISIFQRFPNYSLDSLVFGGKFGGKGFYFGGKNQNIIFYRTENISMKPTNRLTELSIKQTKPKKKQYKLTDGEGMYLRVYPNGSKYWQLQYWFDG